MTVKLTYDEYIKASEAGLISGHACACMGPVNNDEFCGCRMTILSKLTPEGADQMASEWREKYNRRRDIQEQRDPEKYKKRVLSELDPNRLP